MQPLRERNWAHCKQQENLRRFFSRGLSGYLNTVATIRQLGVICCQSFHLGQTLIECFCLERVNVDLDHLGHADGLGGGKIHTHAQCANVAGSRHLDDFARNILRLPFQQASWRNKKPGAVTRPGFGTTLSDTVIAESRFTVKRDVKMKVRLVAWWLSQPRRRQYDGAPMRSRM